LEVYFSLNYNFNFCPQRSYYWSLFLFSCL
jgi:hypothetical protein